MRNFVIFFHEKTGTSPLVRLLEKFDLITVVHQKKNTGYEPFDRHNCGHMSLRHLRKCLDIIYKQGPKNTEKLNRIYTRTAKRPLEVIGENGVVGFKMRFTPPKPFLLHINEFPAWSRVLAKYLRVKYVYSFKNVMVDVLKGMM